jgi:hypothetical protein
MVLPCFQKGGYGKLLIEMSYALSIIEGKPGTPERPLSDLGHRVYVSFWTRRVVKILLKCLEENNLDISIKYLQDKTGMIESDIDYILNHHKIRREQTLFCDRKFLEGIMSLAGKPGTPIDIENIRWKPFNLLSLE